MLLAGLSLVCPNLVLDLLLNHCIDCQVGLAQLLKLALVLCLQLLQTRPHLSVLNIQLAHIVSKSDDALAVDHLLLLDGLEHLVGLLLGGLLYGGHFLALNRAALLPQNLTLYLETGLEEAHLGLSIQALSSLLGDGLLPSL